MKKYIILLLLAVGGFVLVSLAGAALAQWQEASRRATDQCNLKLIALATINTADGQEGEFPQATYPNPYEPPDRRLSWLVSILPCMDSSDLHKQFTLTEPWDSATNLPVAQTRVRSFLCPSAEPQALVPACSSLPTRLLKTCTTSYVGLAGVGPNAAFLLEGNPRCGPFGHHRRTHYPNSFTDGTSQTILVIETAHDNGPWAAGHLATVREIDPEAEPQVGLDAPFGHRETSRWVWQRSLRSTFTHAGLGDGSARAIANTVSAQTLAAAATLAGGDTLGADW